MTTVSQPTMGMLDERRSSEQSPSITIHPEALPCLKRQQLESLCVRLGVKATGKKSELIARLEGFATGQAHTEPQQQYTYGRFRSSSSTLYEENEENAGNDDDMGGDTSLLPSMTSIRIISKPRESHFAAVQANKIDDDGMEEAGVVMRSSGSHGSISSLRRRQKDRSTLSELSINRPPSTMGEFAEVRPDLSKRMPSSSSSLYPWKKLLGGEGRKASSESSASTEQPAPAAMQPTATNATEMGLGLHASASQASISSTVRRWLKGEGSATIASQSGDDRRVTRSISAASTVSIIPDEEKKKDEEVDQALLSPRPKRKRSQESIVATCLNTEQTTSPEIPQRRIKPRPSRAGRRSTVPPTQTQEPIVASTAESTVLTEMYARLAAAKEGRMEEERRKESCSETKEGKPLTPPVMPPSPFKSVQSRTRGRFSSQHEKQFGQMESIASHYAASRREPSADVGRTKRARITSKIDEEVVVVAKAAEGTALIVTDQKETNVNIASPPIVERTEEERRVIRQKLALARQKRRSSTLAGSGGGRKSIANKGRLTTNVGPSAKLLPRTGIAQKISGAVRGFMGAAARGLASSTSASATSTATATATAPPADSKSKNEPSERESTLLSTASPGKAVSNDLAKKRSTFDLQASLARKPNGYTPYSARETVQMLQSPRSTSKATQRSSSVTFPSSSTTRQSPAKAADQGASTPSSTARAKVASPSRASSTVRSPASSTATGRKTRSSTSHAARTSTTLKAPRKSTTANGGSSSSAAPPKSPIRRRQPSLQVANQTVAGSIMRQRRMRLNAMKDVVTQDVSKNSVRSSSDSMTIHDGGALASSANASSTAAGHGSPRKTTVAVRLSGQGRGKMSVRNTSASQPRPQVREFNAL